MKLRNACSATRELEPPSLTWLPAPNLIVIEAKGAEMERGFAQLAAEMLAAHEGLSNSGDIIYGAVTTGDLWRFGILDATKKCIRARKIFLK